MQGTLVGIKTLFFLLVIRRPGCQFCREEAQIFDAQRETIENDMVNQVHRCPFSPFSHLLSFSS